MEEYEDLDTYNGDTVHDMNVDFDRYEKTGRAFGSPAQGRGCGPSTSRDCGVTSIAPGKGRVSDLLPGVRLTSPLHCEPLGGDTLAT